MPEQKAIYIPEGRYIRDLGYKRPSPVIELDIHAVGGFPGGSGEHVTVLEGHWDYVEGPCYIVSGGAVEKCSITFVGQFLAEQLTRDEREAFGRRISDAHSDVTVIKWQYFYGARSDR